MSGHTGSFGFDGCDAGRLTAMATRIKNAVHIDGPYKRDRSSGWYIRIRPPGDRPTTRSFPTRDAAAKAKARLLARQAHLICSVGMMIDQYELHLRSKGNRPESIRTTVFRLRALLPLDVGIATITERKAKALFARYSTAPTRTGEPPSGATLRNTLNQTRTFWRWLIEGEHLPKVNPWDAVKSDKKVRKGKGKLRLDEFNAFIAAAVAERSDASIAALICLLCGLRATEVAQLHSRDVDDGGRLLWVSDEEEDQHLKSEDSDRTIIVPAVLRPLLAELAAVSRGRLFPGRDRFWVSYHVARLCKVAGIRRITAHGARGTVSRLAELEGASPEFIERLLGHAGTAVGADHYTGRAARRKATHQRGLRVLGFGKQE